MRRGIILRPEFRGNITNAGVSDELLRKIILYWDVIEYPFVNGMSPNYEVLKDMKFLNDCKMIETSYVIANKNTAKVVDYPTYRSRQHVVQSTKQLKSIYFNSQIELCEHKNIIDKNTIWSIGDLDDDLSVMFFDNANKEAIQFELYNFLPHPSSTTEINDILEFKNKRKEELLHLRSKIDELSNLIYQNENIDTELKKKKEEIEKSLLDLHRVLDETKFQKVCSSISMYLNLDKSEILKFIANSAVVTSLTSSPILGIGITYGLQVILKISKKKVSTIDKIPDSLKSYLYSYNVEKKIK